MGSIVVPEELFYLLHRKSAEALCTCEKDITSLHQQLQETNKELVQTNKNRESLAQENDRLQEHLSNIKQENQVYLYREPLTKKENGVFFKYYVELVCRHLK